MFVPTTFGKYFLTEHLATGGMAEIYRGKLLGPGGFEKQLVIKQIHPKLGARREFVDLFVAEAKTTVSLSHGNIVPIFELGVVDGTYFIAMEYVDGPTLSELWQKARQRKRRLGPAMAATITAEILKGLDYAHRRGGLIHRDLSPRNVIVSRNGEVKILDFGLAATLENAAELSKLSSGGGRPVGSFPYMSPEQAARAPLDVRSDLFSAGILLWEMLTGETLFGRADEDATLAAVKDAPIPLPSARAPEVPPELDALVARTLERDPAKRWASAGELLTALGRFLYTVEPPVTPETISHLVSEICPDVPVRAPRAATATAPPLAGAAVGGEATTPGDGGTRVPVAGAGTPPAGTPGTQPMARASTEKSFATHVDLERALERNRTPLLPFPALAAAREVVVPRSRVPVPPPAVPPPPAPLPGVAEPAPAAAVAPEAPAAPAAGATLELRARRRGRGALVTLAVAGAVTTAAIGYLWTTRRPAGTTSAPDGAAAAAAAPAAAAAADADADAAPDAAPAAAADAGTAPAPAPAPAADAAPAAPAAAPGRLVVSTPDVAWASIFLDGKRIGETPLPAPGFELPAGRHTLRLVCEAAVCAPDGKQKTLTINVPAGATVERNVRF